MHSLDYFQEEYDKIYFAINRVSSMFLESKDIYSTIAQIQKSLLYASVKKDDMSLDSIKSLLDILNKFLYQIKDLLNTIEESYKTISQLKKY